MFSYYCGYYDPPPSAALEWNPSQGLPAGSGWGLGVLLTVPNRRSRLTGGLWFQANITVHVVWVSFHSPRKGDRVDGLVESPGISGPRGEEPAGVRISRNGLAR